jgi:hypothetical protein
VTVNSKKPYLYVECKEEGSPTTHPCRRRGELLIHDLGTKWGWVVSVTPRPRFTPGERIPGTHCTGGWVGLRAGLETGWRKNLLPVPGIEPRWPGRLAGSQTLYWLSYPAHCMWNKCRLVHIQSDREVGKDRFTLLCDKNPRERERESRYWETFAK